MTLLSKNSLILRFLISLVISVLSMVTPVAQAERARTDLGVEALAAFNERHWGDAHRMYAELLSVEGTSLDFQWRYAVTLLHDARTRHEGFQRLAELRNEEKLSGESLYWWGLSLMKMGKGEEAVMELDRVILELPKRHPIHQDAVRARVRAASLPIGFPRWHDIELREEIDMPWDVWHLHIPPPSQTSRWIKLPTELQNKADRNADRSSVMLIDSRSSKVFFHSWGAKGKSGADVWTATMDEQGRWVDCKPLPSAVNSHFDDIHPVWDAVHETLYFSSDRPGGCGGFDIWKAVYRNGVWENPEHVGPEMNSVHEEWAWIPCLSEDCDCKVDAGWLLTNRGSAFDEVQGLDVVVDWQGKAPVPVMFEWNEEDIPTTSLVTWTDASTGEEVAQVWIGRNESMPALMLPAGQALQMTIKADNGVHATGMLTVPDSDWPYAAKQAFRLVQHEGGAYLDFSRMQVTKPQENLALWGWESLKGESALSEWHREVVRDWAPSSSDPEVAPSRPSWSLEAAAWEKSRELIAGDGAVAVVGTLDQVADIAQDAFEEASGVSLDWVVGDQDRVVDDGAEVENDEKDRNEQTQAEVLGLEPLDKEPSGGIHMSEELMSQYVGLLRQGGVGAAQSVNAALPLRAGWVLGTWHRNRGDVLTWNPESVHSMLKEWPLELRGPWQNVRLTWSAQLANDSEVILRQAWTDQAAIPLLGEEPMFQTTGRNDSMEVAVGEEGLQVGWFRSQPQLGPLLPGTRLHREPGVSGISRWVLLRESDALSYTRMAEWLMASGVADAFEVRWDGQAWRRIANPHVQSQSTESRRQQGEVSDSTRNWVESGEAKTDWPHGEPVPIGELRGTWFAVQLGAFRGSPDSHWIESAGERLVFESFDDGLSRWYAAVNQNREVVRSAWTRFRQRPDFSDAFMVVLRDGRRESMRSMDDEMTYQGTAPHLDSSHLSTVEHVGAAPTASVSFTPEGITWRVDIAKYFGTVPGQDVAVLLLRSADWGVKSWTVKGQTTYCSRSFSDWEEAQQVLEDVRQEGFEGATLVQD
ncbi:MAG: hypothetical protein RLZZ314_616 [Bacteroidota bacterium]